MFLYFPDTLEFAWLLTNIGQLLLSILRPPGLIADIWVWKEYMLLSKYSWYYLNYPGTGLWTDTEKTLLFLPHWPKLCVVSMRQMKCLEGLTEETIWVFHLPSLFATTVELEKLKFAFPRPNEGSKDGIEFIQLDWTRKEVKPHLCNCWKTW
jgi:hypothetical protein